MNDPKVPSYAEWFIAKSQLTSIRDGLNLTINQAILKMNEAKDPLREKEFIRQLQVNVAKLEIQLKEVENWPRRRASLWDRLKIKLYEWSTQDRVK